MSYTQRRVPLKHCSNFLTCTAVTAILERRFLSWLNWNSATNFLIRANSRVWFSIFLSIVLSCFPLRLGLKCFWFNRKSYFSWSRRPIILKQQFHFRSDRHLFHVLCLLPPFFIPVSPLNITRVVPHGNKNHATRVTGKPTLLCICSAISSSFFSLNVFIEYLPCHFMDNHPVTHSVLFLVITYSDYNQENDLTITQAGWVCLQTNSLSFFSLCFLNRPILVSMLQKDNCHTYSSIHLKLELYIPLLESLFENSKDFIMTAKLC